MKPTHLEKGQNIQGASIFAKAANLLSLRLNGSGGREFRDVVLMFLFTLVIFSVDAAVLQFSGLSIGRWGGDSAAHELAIDYGIVGGSMADQVVATLGRYFKIGNSYGAVPTMVLILMLAITTIKCTGRELLIALFLTLPTLYQLQYASKESVLIVAWAILLLLVSIVRSDKGRAIICFSIILILAATFRKYYYISAGIMALLYTVKSPSRASLGLFSSMTVISFIPPIRNPILIPKFMVSRGLSGASSSKIPVLFPGFSPLGLIGNYVVSLAYIAFPILGGFRPQELYMQIYSLILMASGAYAYKHGERATASMFIGIVLTLPVFVPDVGTFARHVGAALPILLISLHQGRTKAAAPAKKRSRENALLNKSAYASR